MGMKTKTFKWWAFFYVLVILFCFYPYEFYSVYFPILPDKSLITGSFFIVLTIPFLLIKKIETSTIYSVLAVFFVQWIGFFIAGIAHRNIYPILGNSINMLLALVLVLFISSYLGLRDFYEKYNRWILLMAILGCVTFFLVITINFKPFFLVLDRADGRPIYNYLLTFSKSEEEWSGIMRYSGFFDEPGTIACWGMYAMIINRLFIKNHRIEIFLAVSLLFTFSIGYYIQLVVYLFFFFISKKKIGQNIILAFLIGMVIWGISMTKDTNNNEIYNQTVGRIERIFDQSRDNSNTIAVDDRASLTENARKEFLENPLFGTSRSNVKVGNNIYETLALYGIVGATHILFPFILLIIWGIKYKDYTLLKCSIVIILGFTHRPFHPNVLYCFVLYSIIVMYKQKRLYKA